MTPREHRISHYLAGKTFRSDAEREEARSAYGDALDEAPLLPPSRGENYGAGHRGDDATDFADEAAWAEHMRSLHGKVVN